ncbi:hypothetical protein EHI8A_005420 [Entamoeba histolytica HM-1:IMSS-B]|uniref:TLDc domain-containing protein n=5 Tax=Entamoeba histolytica TaxID=5759 RepID=C4LUY6_ENTH1|nr:hypothetical protein EHI_092210 [Entamoeba histolytica HM-1:IMSS]EMD47024.1 Hypothetical protein EHI5A_020280 [Entamoeba histolytica KU27]EMH73154.1 hypothetical protein EHI8A_005420 [Entamoeba histolytica HM-1:IMSS-B]ENY61816.1 hypothetical protein EHI7A_008430 [Entamoeba histolytica HM-1:IMSS-A]GAT92454.1 hypothetical protein CL6EHI_092210 [Entamoeba histolytica]EAL49164.1 hypothetical protein EHI_092210 [Entamoeba histolytica HM-1:IMSS]|eukprot:XP_654550.1 hypothetical protein EHI_092210 [Entamoeba histolytica HM-1:IMSS]
MNQEIFICGVNVGVNEIVTGKLLNEIVFNLLNQIGMSTSSTILQSNKALSLTQSQDTSYQSIQKIEGIQSHPIERKNDRYKSALRNPSSQINLETSCSLFTNNICTIPTTKQTNSKQTKSEIIQPTESFNPLDKRIKERAKTEMITKEIFIQEDEDFKGDLKYIKESLKYFYKWTELSQCQLIFDSTIEYDPDEYEVSSFNRLILNKENLLLIYQTNLKSHLAGIFIKDKIKVIGKNILKENNFPFSLKCNGELDIIKKFVRSKTQGVSPLELTLTQTNQIDLKNKPFFFIYGNRDISLKVGLSSCYSTLCDEFIDIRGTLNCCTAMGGSCFNVGRIVVVQLY